MRIVAGTVRYEDGIKTVAGDQYSPTRRVAVELNFSLDAADANGSTDPAIQAVLDKAQAFVNGKLGIKGPTAAAMTAVASLGTKAVPTPATDAAKPKRAPKVTPPSDELTPSTGKTKDDLAREAGADAKIEGKNEDALVLSAEAAKPAAKDPDDLSDLTATSEAPKISDAELNDACQKTMQKITTPENPGGPRIRAVIGKYMPEGAAQALQKVPQDKRAEFLQALEALTK